MSNQECKIRPKLINVNSNEPSFCPDSIERNKCIGRCNNINDPYTKLCVSDVVKNMNVKVFNLLLRTNEIKHIEWHQTCKCKCRLQASLCSDKQRCNGENADVNIKN